LNAFEEIELRELRTRFFGRPVRSYGLTDSTNQRLLEWAGEGAPHGASCIAEAQSAGRGRQGRNWTSESGQGLFASLLLRPERALAGVSSFSLVVALAVAGALRETGLCRAQLKWPNDIWWRERKLAGILLEARGGSNPMVVVGLGLNLWTPSGGWPAELRDRAIALEEGPLTPPVAAEIWGEVLNQLEPRWELYSVEGFAAFQQEWRASDLLMGRAVEIEEGGHRLRAQVDGVDPQGRLLVRLDDGRKRALEAGEVHLNPGEAP